MTSKFPSSTPDVVDEDSIREVLRAYAPKLVNVDAGWTAVSHRVSAQIDRPLAPTRDVPARQPWMRRWRLPRVAAALAVAVVLMGASAAGGHYLWGWPFGPTKAWVIGDQNLYTQINQTQTVDGVTISLIEGYADPGNTYLAYSIQMSPALRQRYTFVTIGSWDFTDQFGEEPSGGNIFCQAPPQDGGAQYCLMDQSAFAPQAGVTQLSLTLNVSRIYVNDNEGSRSAYDALSGPWHFAFTLPWHAQSLGAGGPYAQPTTPPSR